MPLISVVIPVFNGEATILETIESVLSQTFSDFEIIVINDGSQDSTLKIVSNIADPRLKVFTYPNAGLAASRNRGVKQSQGEYIAFLDADDLWTPDKLGAQLSRLQDNPEVAVVYSWTDFINEYSDFLRPAAHFTVSGNVLPKLLLTNFLDNGSNPLIRKQALIDVGGLDESLKAAEDWDLYLRLAVRHPFEVVQSPQILYRVSADSMSGNVFRQETETLKVIDKIFAQVPESLKYLRPYSLANIYKYLTFKALNGAPVRRRGIVAIKFLFLAILNEPALFQKRVIWKVLLKSLVVITLPQSLAQNLLERIQHLANLETLLIHIKADVPPV
ncbi:MAG: glycosyltransferase [Leptolyngbyaceae cyanobacterium MO_188.B28]|nr:glycosyltransferase [Leptolyngbyaceae cyanobacterium MO_188.B28]